MRADVDLQSRAYQEVRESLCASPGRPGETVDYRQRPGPRSSRINAVKIRNRDQDSDEDEPRFTAAQQRGVSNHWGQNMDEADVVKRLSDKSLEKQEKLEMFRFQQEEKAAKEHQFKPKINEYDYKSLNRVPLHMRDYQNFGEKRDEEQRKRLLMRQLQDQDECTFKPNINKNEHLRAKTPSELIEWKRERDNMMAMKRIENPDINGTECTFKPHINEKSKRITAEYNSGSGLPLRKSKKQYVDEYLKKEREDLFKPKVNVNSKNITKSGYDKPAEIEVKQLKKKIDTNLLSKSTAQSRRPSRDYSTDNHHFDEHLTPLTAEEIIERYKREAKPQKKIQKIPFDRNREKSTRDTKSVIYDVKPAEIKQPKTVRLGKLSKNEDLNDILKAANQKLEHQRSLKSPSRSPRKKHAESAQENNGQMIPALDHTHSNNCYRFDREPAFNQAFDSSHWYENVKDRNTEVLKKKVENLIYSDKKHKKTPKSSANKSITANIPLTQHRTAHK